MRLKIFASLEQVRENVINSERFGNAVYAEWIEEDKSLFVVFENYAGLTKNYMTISIVCKKRNNYTDMHFVAGGAGAGWLNMDWGANDRRLGKLYGLLDQLGYHYEEYN